jgi:hypothetical protein
MEITQQIRDYAAAEGMSVDQAVEAGLAGKAAEYRRDER